MQISLVLPLVKTEIATLKWESVSAWLTHMVMLVSTNIAHPSAKNMAFATLPLVYASAANIGKETLVWKLIIPAPIIAPGPTVTVTRLQANVRAMPPGVLLIANWLPAL